MFCVFHLWCSCVLCLCLCHSKYVSSVLLDKQAGTVGVFEQCVLLGTYHEGAREKAKH